MRPTSYDKRIVRFEEIHDVQEADLLEFVRRGELRDGCNVLDVGCGYGAVTAALVGFVASKAAGFDRISIDLVDESPVQLGRARDEVAGVLRKYEDGTEIALNFYLGSFPDDFDHLSNRYDIIYAKQVIHESPKDRQNCLVKALFRALRPGGRLIVWEVALDADREIGDLFRRTIQEKDRLAGFETLQTNRYFLDRTDLLNKMQDGGGSVPTVLRTVPYRFRSHSRLGPELRGDLGALARLNAYVVQEYERLSPSKRSLLNFKSTDTSVEFDVPVVVASAVKAGRVTTTSLSLFAEKVFEKPDSPEFQGHFIETAIADESSGRLLTELGPCLLRFSLVQWNEHRKPELASSGLDFVLNWGESWHRPAEAYFAYLASLFARSGGSAEESFKESATGFVARWFAGCGSAAIAHFELHEDVVRLAAFTIPARVVDETKVILPKQWHTVLSAFEDHIRSAAQPASRDIGPSGVRITGDAIAATADDVARRIAAEVPKGNVKLDYLASKMPIQATTDPAPDLILRLASYLKLSDCRHAYYLVPPSLVFKKIPRFPAGKPARFEAGNLHITTQSALDPQMVIELLHWQSAVWQNLASVDVLLNLIKADPNS